MTNKSRHSAPRSFRELIVWQKSVELAVLCYAVASRLPAAERFELARQLRRASVSIGANIAEGAGRKHSGDYARFLSIARGSQAEVETLLEVIRRLGFASEKYLEPARAMADEVGRMLTVMLGRRMPSRKPSP